MSAEEGVKSIDRIVHHSVVLEFDVPSYRTNAAQNRQTEENSDRPKWLTWIIRLMGARERLTRSDRLSRIGARNR